MTEFNELKKEGLVIDYWADYEHSFKDHVETIKGMLTSSALVLEEKVEQERATLEKKKSGLNLTQLTDDVTINGISWRDLKHKLVSKDFDFYSFWVSIHSDLIYIYLENFVS